jgi:predicted porin
MGMVVAYGDATVTLAQNTKKAGTTYDFSSDAVGITYKMSDSLTIAAYTGTTEDDKDSAHEITDTGLGFTYTITPGLSVSVTHNDWDLKDGTTSLNADGEYTTVAIDISF